MKVSFRRNQETIKSDFVSMFRLPNDKVYIILSLGEYENNRAINVRISEVSQDKLLYIIDDNEWNEIKECIKSIINGNETAVRYVPYEERVFDANNIFSRILSISVRSMEVLSSDYENKVSTSIIEEDEEIVEEQKVQEDDNLDIPILENNIMSSDINPTFGGGLSSTIDNVSVDNTDVDNTITNTVNNNISTSNNDIDNYLRDELNNSIRKSINSYISKLNN